MPVAWQSQFHGIPGRGLARCAMDN